MTKDRIALIIVTATAVAFGAGMAVTAATPEPATLSLSAAGQPAGSTMVGTFILKTTRTGVTTLSYCSGPVDANMNNNTSCRTQSIP